MYGDCRECKRLWEEYSKATEALAGVVGETVVAEIQQSNAVRQELEPLKLAAAERRGKARLALTEHEAASHQNRKRA